jgi:hypothetical protein
VSEAASFAAWLGAALIVVSDGRRALALGLALITVAFTAVAWVGGERLAAVALLCGGAVAVIRRARTGPDVWGVMPPGSTPRLVLSISGGLLALWIAASVMTGDGAPLRFAALSVVGLMGARLLMTDCDPAAALTALVALALSVAIGSGISDTGLGPSPYIAAALIALGVSFVRVPESSGA